MYAPALQFGAWQPIETAAVAAPDAPGVLQARTEALLAYPRGKSAMVLYAHSGAGHSLRGLVEGGECLARAVSSGACYVRFAEAPEPQAFYQRLLATFTERFGAPPRANESQMGTIE